MKAVIDPNNGLLALTATGQGIFYILTGIWPMVSMSTFLAVTGPKTDLWLVNTVGAMVLCSGLVILTAALRKALTREVIMLAITNALALTAIDIVYVSAGRIDPIYLADAAAELILVGMYTASMLRR